MKVELLTQNDLQQFKAELLTELKKLMSNPAQTPVKYLKSKEVKEKLGISNSTLQTLREKHELGRKVGGVWYFAETEIQSLFNAA